MPDTNSLTTTRAQRTHDRIDSGVLPPPKDAKLWVGNGSGTSCTGCGDIIAKQEREYELVFRDAVMLRFHSECFGTWTNVSAVNGA